MLTVLMGFSKLVLHETLDIWNQVFIWQSLYFSQHTLIGVELSIWPYQKEKAFAFFQHQVFRYLI